MELVIPGLILVAFMVWASTRIKRTAAAAFDAEHIETDQFSIDKPEGFLHVLNDDSGLAFRAYSKEFGKVGDRDVRRATIEIERHAGVQLDDVVAGIEKESELIVDHEAYIDGGERAATMATVDVTEGGEYSVNRKIVTRGPDVFEVRYSVLSEAAGEHSKDIENTMGSVHIK